MKQIFSARKQLLPYLMSSALVVSVMRGGGLGREEVGDALAGTVVVAADHEPGGMAQVLEGAPSRRNSGQKTSGMGGRPRQRRAASRAEVPGGTVLLITRTVPGTAWARTCGDEPPRRR